MLAFYIFGAPDIQQIFPILFEASKKEKCWVAFFDCYEQKRQLYNYDQTELINFVKEKSAEFNIIEPIISYYGKEDKDRYTKDYINNKPESVFVGNIWCGNGPQLIHPHWYPVSNKSKNNYVTGWDEAFVLATPFTHVDYCIYKGRMTERIFNGNDPFYRQYDKEFFRRFPGKYYGNLLLDHYNYDIPEDKKICFIPENYIRKMNDGAKEYSRFCDGLIYYLQYKGFYVVWKQREKGHPLNWYSPLALCHNKPDLLIDRDLYFPSSLFHYGYNSDICLILNTTWSFYDVKNINSNVVVLKTPGHKNWSRSPEEQFSRFEEFGDKYEGEIVNMIDFDYSKLDKYLEKKNNIKLEKSHISRRILDECCSNNSN